MYIGLPTSHLNFALCMRIKREISACKRFRTGSNSGIGFSFSCSSLHVYHNVYMCEYMYDSRCTARPN